MVANRTGVRYDDTCMGSIAYFDRHYALERIQFIAQNILPGFGLQLAGKVWYQGKLAVPGSMPARVYKHKQCLIR